jgi:type IV pilus assembly protein PilA
MTSKDAVLTRRYHIRQQIACQKEEISMVSAMLKRLHEAQAGELEGDEAAEAGFTLIELMVVLLIIAILLAIAIPTFLGVTSSANDRAAQSNLTNGLTEASSQYQAYGQTYSFAGTDFNQAALNSSAPEFTWTNGGNVSANQNVMSVADIDVGTLSTDTAGGPLASTAVGDQAGFVEAAFSQKTNTCWFILSMQVNPGSVANGPVSASAPQKAGGVVLTKGGTYYAKIQPASTTAAHCSASFPLANAFNWGSSFSNPGVN